MQTKPKPLMRRAAEAAISAFLQYQGEDQIDLLALCTGEHKKQTITKSIHLTVVSKCEGF